MKNKAFTLIELLAVIVILAIIALIATPIVLNIINDSKSSARERTAELVYVAAENAYVTNIMNKATFTNEDVISDIKISNEKSRTATSITTMDGVTCTLSSSYMLTCTYDGENVIEPKSVNHEPPVCQLNEGYTSKQVGAEYTCYLDTDRTFYILKVNSDTIDLIMDSNFIDATVPVTMKWCVSANNNSCNHDNLDPYIEHIQGVFGSKVTVSLPTYQQIYDVNSSKTLTSRPELYGNLDSDNSTIITRGYWTSTPDSSNAIYAWFVSYSGTLSSNNVATADKRGVRPVITISENLIN